MLKPVDDPADSGWCAEVMERIPELGFRVPRPLRTRDGGFIADDWSASRLVAGETHPGQDWAAVLAAGRAFHRQLADEPRPEWFARRDHPWAVGDRVAWGEAEVVPLPEVAGLFRVLRDLVRPVRGVNQVIHGDLAGNVMFAEGLEPAVIDFSPYWRPVGYADAVVAVDGMLWWGAGAELAWMARAGSGFLADADFAQMLVRAALFRLVTVSEAIRIGTRARDDLAEELAGYEPVVRVIRAMGDEVA